MMWLLIAAVVLFVLYCCLVAGSDADDGADRMAAALESKDSLTTSHDNVFHS